MTAPKYHPIKSYWYFRQIVQLVFEIAYWRYLDKLLYLPVTSWTTILGSNALTDDKQV